MEDEYVLRMEGISKQFPGVRALRDVKLNARKGSVHALMGENGAGKSTLMKFDRHLCAGFGHHHLQG